MPLWKNALAIFLISLVLRGALLLVVAPYPDRLLHRDSGSYLQPAVNLLAGQGFSQQHEAPFVPGADRTPVYPLFVALLFAVSGQHLLALAAVQVVLSSFTAALAYLLGARLLPESGARIGGWIFAISLSSIVYSLYLVSETLFTLLLLGVHGALLVYAANRQRRWLVAVGLLLGLAILSRPVALLYPLAAALLILIVHRGRWWVGTQAVALFLAVSALLVTPWLMRNYRLVGVPTLATIVDYNLLFYNAVSLEAELRGLGEAEVRAEMMAQVDEEVARRGVAREREVATRVELYRQWSRQIILADPWRYVVVHLKPVMPYVCLLAGAGFLYARLWLQQRGDRAGNLDKLIIPTEG